MVPAFCFIEIRSIQIQGIYSPRRSFSCNYLRKKVHTMVATLIILDVKENYVSISKSKWLIDSLQLFEMFWNIVQQRYDKLTCKLHKSCFATYK